MGIVYLFLAFPLVCLAIATIRRCSKGVRRVLIFAAFAVVAFDGGCAHAASEFGRATGAGSDDEWRPIITGLFVIVLIWSVLILFFEGRRELYAEEKKRKEIRTGKGKIR